MANFNFVINSSFKPFTFDEMIKPFNAYKEAFEQSEEKYLALQKETSKFKELENLPEGSKAKEIYDGYAGDLAARAKSFSDEGFTMGNRRALTSLRRRYDDEIGMLDRAKTRLDDELKLRRELVAKDSSLIFANKTPTIDDYLYEGSANNYSISRNELYTRGSNLGKTWSSREYADGKEGKSVIGKLYKEYILEAGIGNEDIEGFINSEPIQQRIESLLTEKQVRENITDPYDLEAAKQSIINGIYDGIVYSRNISLQRDGNYMDAEQRSKAALGWASLAEQKAARREANAVARHKIDKAAEIAALKINKGETEGKEKGSTTSSDIDEKAYVFDEDGDNYTGKKGFMQTRKDVADAAAKSNKKLISIDDFGVDKILKSNLDSKDIEKIIQNKGRYGVYVDDERAWYDGLRDDNYYIIDITEPNDKKQTPEEREQANKDASQTLE